MKKERMTENAELKTVGAQIRAQRQKKGKKQATLAQEAGISAAQLCHLEKNDVQPSIKTLGRIAEALGTTVAELLEGNARSAMQNAQSGTEGDGTGGGDALSSDALDRVQCGMGNTQDARTARQEDSPHPGQCTVRNAQGAKTARPEGSPHRSAEDVEPVTGLWRVHDARDAAVDRRVRARLRRETEAWKKIERKAGVAGSATLPLFFPAAAERGALLAREVRTAGGLGTAAGVDPVAFLEGKGFRVLVTKLPAGLDSWSLWDPDDGTAFVFLREAATPERKRFRAAFELGHLARFISGGFRPLRDIGASRKASRAFAAAFLLPEEAVRESAHGLAIGPEDWTWELVLALKARFGTSAETFLYRIEELGMISRSRNRAFRRLLEEHYVRCRAAGKKDLEPPAPRNAGGRLGALKIRAASSERAE